MDASPADLDVVGALLEIHRKRAMKRRAPLRPPGDTHDDHVQRPPTRGTNEVLAVAGFDERLEKSWMHNTLVFFMLFFIP